MKNAFIRRVESLEKKVADGKADESDLIDAVQQEQAYAPKERLRLFLDDVTPEKLTSTMAANGGVCAIMSAEGGIFDTFAGRYSGSANFDVALKAFSGDPIRVDRSTRPSKTILNPALTLLLMAQPGVLAEVMGNEAFRGKGLTARILYSVPRSRVGTRRSDAPTVPPEIRQDYNALIRGLIAIHAPEPEEIFLSPEAEELRRRYADVIEEALPEEYANMKDWAGKIAGTTLRIVALLCLAEAGPDGRVCTGPWAEFPHYEITEEQLYRAMTISTYFIEHAKAAYCRLGVEAVTERSHRTLAWIRKKEKREVSLRGIQRACTFLQNASDVQAVLDRLEESGYLLVKDPEQRHRPGRPSNPVYAVNPLLYGKKLPARKQ